MSDVRPQALVGQLLRQQRKSAGLTQAEVATRLRAPQSFVSKYESGERKLDLVEVYAICNALKTTLSKFSELLETSLKESA